MSGSRKMIKEFFLFLDENRSRYEQQAQLLLSQTTLETQIKDYKIEYSVKDGCFSSLASSSDEKSIQFSFEVPIPKEVQQQIEELVQLFAKSEAACK